MFRHGDRVVWKNWIMGVDKPSSALGTVLYAYSIWNAPTMRSDSYNPAEDWKHARYIVKWDNGTLTRCEPESHLFPLFEGM